MEQSPNVYPSWPNTCRLHADTPERLGTHPFDSPELGEALKTIELSAEITGKSSSAHASALASSVTEGLAWRRWRVGAGLGRERPCNNRPGGGFGGCARETECASRELAVAEDSAESHAAARWESTTHTQPTDDRPNDRPNTFQTQPTKITEKQQPAYDKKH